MSLKNPRDKKLRKEKGKKSIYKDLAFGLTAGVPTAVKVDFKHSLDYTVTKDISYGVH